MSMRRSSDFAGDRMRLWRRWLGDAAGGGYGWRPSTDLYEVAGGVLVQVEIAGLSGGDYTVHCDERRLSIFGERKSRGERRPLKCHLVEIASGRFRTDVELPWRVDSDGLEVDYADGIVSVYVPRVPESAS